MGDVISFPIALDSDLGRELIVDCCRFQEEILTEKQVRKKYRFDASAWEALGNDENLIEKIESERLRRIRDGSAKREKSQLLVVKAPDVAASIMNSAEANDRHRLDACKVLNDFAANGPQGVPASDRFQITIVLNSDVERYDKSIAVDVNDIDPNHIEDTPRGPWPVIAANRRKDDGGGEPV